MLTEPVLPDLPDGLVRTGVPHLAVWAGEAIGVIGPLVRPGRSACLRCVELRKADADPQWPRITAQATLARVRPRACDTALAAMAAAMACAQALLLIDRAGPAALGPATVGGTLEVVLPDWRWRRRSWAPHPACRCGAAGAGFGARSAAGPEGGRDRR